MAKAIVEGMEKERDVGNLDMGKVGNSLLENNLVECENLQAENNIVVQESEIVDIASEPKIMNDFGGSDKIGCGEVSRFSDTSSGTNTGNFIS